MTAVLFPRLDALAVDQRLERLPEIVEEALRPIVADRFPAETAYAAVGGQQATLDMLRDLRALLVDVAQACGYPDRGSVADRARFDLEATRVLADFEPLQSGEGDRDDIWAFVATVLAPDVTAWRFGGRSAERFHGGVRNVFQRLWMRAVALDGGADAGAARWALLEPLTEDALVQLTERPALGADPILCQGIAGGWTRKAARDGRRGMEAAMRDAIKRIRIRNEIQMLSALPDAELTREIDHLFG